MLSAVGMAAVAVALLSSYGTKGDSEPAITPGVYGVNVQDGTAQARALREAVKGTAAELEGPPPGMLMPAFAAPLASGTLDGDANVRQSRSTGDDQARKVPACEVHGRGVLNSCDLRRKATVMTFIVTQGADCEPQVERAERIKREFPDANFVVVASGRARSEVGKLAAKRRWSQPVAVDTDGAVVNLYGIGVCPTTVFAYPGGKVRSTKLGDLGVKELRAETRALLR